MKNLVREYIELRRHLALGTVDPDGRPRVTVLDFVMDRDYGLYFRTPPTTRHAMNIAEDSRVSAVIAHEHAFGEKPVQVVTLIGTAALLGLSEEREAVAPLFVARLGANEQDILARAALGTSAFYRLDVDQIEFYGPLLGDG